MKYKLRNNKKGFTLVELIVVLTILAVLAAMLIPAHETEQTAAASTIFGKEAMASLTNDTEK